MTDDNMQHAAPPKRRRGFLTCLVIALAVLVVLMGLCSCCFFGALSLVGAKGQPGTLISPSEPAAGKPSGTSIKIPLGLSATAKETSINLAWNAVNDGTAKVAQALLFHLDVEGLLVDRLGGRFPRAEIFQLDLDFAGADGLEGPDVRARRPDGSAGARVTILVTDLL